MTVRAISGPQRGARSAAFVPARPGTFALAHNGDLQRERAAPAQATHTRSLRHRMLALLVGCATLGAAWQAQAAATFVIVNADEAGVGFNDPSAPPADAGCEVGETLGACRLRALNEAAAKWGALLTSAVPIEVSATMPADGCFGTSAVLSSVLPTYGNANFANAPMPDIAYEGALANALSGVDNDPALPEITITINRDLDTPECFTGNAGWWYGSGTDLPANRLPFVTETFGELSRGLGFNTWYDSSSGESRFGDTPVWGTRLYDTEEEVFFAWVDDGSRANLMFEDTTIIWAGALANKRAQEFLSRPPAVRVHAPEALVGDLAVVKADAIGPNVFASPVTADLALVDDGVAANDGGTPGDGCELPFTSDVAGKIAMLDRGLCNFTLKASNAQASGAVGVIIVNNAGVWNTQLGGSDPAVTIPILGIDQDPGNALKGALPSPGVNATLGTLTDGPRSGTLEGCIRMDAPASGLRWHFADDAFPTPLLTPFIEHRVSSDPGLILAVLQDIGWPTEEGIPVSDFHNSFEDGEVIEPWALQDNPCAYAGFPPLRPAAKTQAVAPRHVGPPLRLPAQDRLRTMAPRPAER